MTAHHEQIPQHLKACLQAVERGNTFLHFAWVGQSWTYSTDLPTDSNCKLNLPLSLSRHSGAAVLKKASDRELPQPLQAGDAVVACASKYIAGTHGDNCLSHVKSVAKPNSLLNVCFASHTQMGSPLKVAAFASDGIRATCTGSSVQCMGLTLAQVQMVQTPHGDELTSSLVSHSRGCGPQLVAALLVTAVQTPALFLGDIPAPGDIIAMVNGVSLLQLHQDKAGGQPWQVLDAQLLASRGTSSLVLYKAPLHGPHSTSTPYAVLARQTGLLMYLTRLMQEFMGRFPQVQRAHQLSFLAASMPSPPRPPPQNSLAFVAPVPGPAQGTTLLEEVVFGAAISRFRFSRRLQEIVRHMVPADWTHLLLPAAGMVPSPDFGKARGVVGTIVAQATGPGAFGASLARDHSRSLRFPVGMPAPPLAACLRTGPISAVFSMELAHSVLSMVLGAMGIAKLRGGSNESRTRAGVATAALLPSPGDLLNRTDPASMEQTHLAWCAQWQSRRASHSTLLLRILYARQFVKSSTSLARATKLLQSTVQQSATNGDAILTLRRQVEQQQLHVHKHYGKAPFVGDLETASGSLRLPSNTADILASACEATRVPVSVSIPALLEGVHQLLAPASTAPVPVQPVAGSTCVQRALELTRRVVAGMGIRANMRDFFAQKLAQQRTEALSANPLPPGYSTAMPMASAGAVPVARGPRVPLVRSGSSSKMDKGAFVAVHASSSRIRSLVDPSCPPPELTRVTTATLQPQSEVAHPMLPSMWRTRNMVLPAAQGLGAIGHRLVSDVVWAAPSLLPNAALLELMPDSELPGTFGEAGASTLPAPRKQFKSKRGTKYAPQTLGEHATSKVHAARLLLGAREQTAAGRWVGEPGGVLMQLRAALRGDALQAQFTTPSTFGMHPLQRRLVRDAWGRDLHLDGYDSEEEADLPLAAPASKRKREKDGTPKAVQHRKDVVWGPWRGVSEAHARRRAAARAANSDSEKLACMQQWGELSATLDPLQPTGISVHTTARLHDEAVKDRVLCMHSGVPTAFASAARLAAAAGENGQPFGPLSPQQADTRVAGTLDTLMSSLAVSVPVADPQSVPPNLAQLLAGVTGASMFVDMPPMSWAAIDALHVSRLGIQLPAESMSAKMLGRRQWSAPTVSALLHGLDVDGDYGLAVPGTWKAGARKGFGRDDSLLRSLFSVDVGTGDFRKPVLSSEALAAQRALLLASAADTPVLSSAYTAAQWWDKAKAAWAPGPADSSVPVRNSLLQHLAAQSGATGAIARAGIRELSKAVGDSAALALGHTLAGANDKSAFGDVSCAPPPPASGNAGYAGGPSHGDAVAPIDVIGPGTNGAWEVPYVPPPGWWDDSRRAAVAELGRGGAAAAPPVQSGVQATVNAPAGRGQKWGRSVRQAEADHAWATPLPICARVGCCNNMSSVSKYCSTACGVTAARMRLQAALQFCADIVVTTSASSRAPKPSIPSNAQTAGAAAINKVDSAAPPVPQPSMPVSPQSNTGGPALGSPEWTCRFLASVVCAAARCVFGSAVAENSEQECARVSELFALSNFPDHGLPLGGDGFPLLPPVIFAALDGDCPDATNEAHRRAMQECTLATWFSVGDTGAHMIDTCSGNSHKRRHAAASLQFVWEQQQRQMLGLAAQPVGEAAIATAAITAARPSRRRRKTKRTSAQLSDANGTMSITPAAQEPSSTVPQANAAQGAEGATQQHEAVSQPQTTQQTDWESFSERVLGQLQLPDSIAPSAKQAFSYALASVAHVKQKELRGVQPSVLREYSLDTGVLAAKAVSRIRLLSGADPIHLSRACSFPGALQRSPPDATVLLAACASSFESSPVPSAPVGSGRMVQSLQGDISVQIDSHWHDGQSSSCAAVAELPVAVPSHGIPQASTCVLPHTGGHKHEPVTAVADSDLELRVQQLWAEKRGPLVPWLQTVSLALAKELSMQPLPVQLQWAEAVCGAMYSMMVECTASMQPLDDFAGPLGLAGLIDTVRAQLQEDTCSARSVDCCKHACWEQSLDSRLSAGTIFDLADVCNMFGNLGREQTVNRH